MSAPLDLLIVEDNPDDAQLMLLHLTEEGYTPQWRRVETKEDYLEALREPPDLILADWALTGFSGLEALNLLKAAGLYIPFILVSGSIGEETAVEAMREGASDYILKDRMGRLGISVRRALDETRLRRERIAADETLRTERRLFREILDQFPYGIYIVNKDYGIEFANKALARDFGETPSCKCHEFLHERHDPCPWCENRKVLEGQTVERPWHSHKTGKDYKLVAIPLKNPEGSLSTLVVFHDITGRRKAEEELMEQKAFLSTLIDCVPIPIFYKDIEGRYMGVNKAYEDLSGCSRGELIGKTIMDIQPQEAAAFHHQVDLDLIRDGNIVHYESDYLRLSGENRNLAISKTVFRDANGSPAGIVAALLDITQRKESEVEARMLQTQLAQAQKMEAVGRLAGGVAHDFNNMLSTILGFTELAMVKLDRANPLYADLQEVYKAGKRSSEIVRQLMAFARRQPVSPRVLNINETMEGMLKMLRRLIGEDIDLAWKPQAGLWQVMTDPSQLDQIMANLCVNARDALPQGGKITIETRNVSLDEGYCAMNERFEPGSFAMLAVSDNGCGMDRETIEKIFEPFFTTKEIGKGTGLGLSTVYGIVKQSRGFINVYSEPGKGTTFKIYLPRHIEEGKGPEASREDEVPVGHGETILLVEDEDAVLDVAKRILQRLEYKTLAARRPDDAIGLALSYPGDIHLLLTDVIMPQMNGKELAQRLKALRPGLKVLFMSGYTADAIALHGVLDEGVEFIQKPLSRQELGRKIREIITKE